MKMHQAQRGFTLVEIAIALAVIAILGTSVLMAVRVQMTQRQISETRDSLGEARGALLAYAAATGRLPCPAQGGSPGNGNETPPDAQGCSLSRGLLPWETLGIRALDGWNHRLAYQVTSGFGVKGLKTGSDVGLDAKGDVVIQNASGQPMASTDAVAAAVWSLGANGRFASALDGTPVGGGAGGVIEKANDPAYNTKSGLFLVADSPIEIAGQEYDDEVMWISRFVLFGRMMDAGQLP